MATSKPPHKPTTPAPDRRQGTPQAGRIVHDERGNARWQLGGDASHSDSTSRVLRSLEVPDLAVEGQDELAQPAARQAGKSGQPPQRKPSESGPANKRQRVPMVDAGGGYNPYDLTVPVKKKPTRGSGRAGLRAGNVDCSVAGFPCRK